MSTVSAFAPKSASTTLAPQDLLAQAKAKAQELADMIDEINGLVAQGVYTPVPPRPKLEVVGEISGGTFDAINGLNGLQMNPDR